MLRRAKVTVIVASAGAVRRVVCSRGTVIEADCVLGDVAHSVFDCIALPGGLAGAKALAAHDALIAMLRQQRDAGRLVAAVCASPALVRHARVLFHARNAN